MPSFEQLGAIALIQEFKLAQARLADATRRFDTRETDRARDCALNNRVIRESGGTYGIPQEELGLRWAAQISQLTRDLIEAEEAFERAKIAAVEGGWESHDVDSEVIDDSSSDDYRYSFDDTASGSAGRLMIEEWSKSVPDEPGSDAGTGAQSIANDGPSTVTDQQCGTYPCEMWEIWAAAEKASGE